MSRKITLCACMALFFSNSLLAQRDLNLNGYSKAKMQLQDFKYDSIKLVKAHPDSTAFTFFEIFDDSVVVYLDGKQVWTGAIYEKNNPFTSTGWSGIDISVAVKGKRSVAVIKLVNQKEYIRFPVFREVPAYMIQRYNGLWYVRMLYSPVTIL